MAVQDRRQGGHVRGHVRMVPSQGLLPDGYRAAGQRFASGEAAAGVLQSAKVVVQGGDVGVSLEFTREQGFCELATLQIRRTYVALGLESTRVAFL